MTEAVIVTGLTLLVLGIVFVVAGRSGERGYWTQRDTTEVPGQDDTRLSEVASKAWHYAVRGSRPSLRIMAIGLILSVVGLILTIVGVVLFLV